MIGAFRQLVSGVVPVKPLSKEKVLLGNALQVCFTMVSEHHEALVALPGSCLLVQFREVDSVCIDQVNLEDRGQ
jgi:hypothetical protein